MIAAFSGRCARTGGLARSPVGLFEGSDVLQDTRRKVADCLIKFWEPDIVVDVERCRFAQSKCEKIHTSIKNLAGVRR